MPLTWKTLYLPESFPKGQPLRNYVFGHNETHMALVLDYSSIFNYHKNGNVKPGQSPGSTYADTFAAAKNIAAGQEILYRYGSVEWFEQQDIHYVEVDIRSTMWRPKLTALPCRQNVRHAIGADGRPSFAVVANSTPAGTVVDISLCVDISLVVVDQFPHLWDFVLVDRITQPKVSASEDASMCCPAVYSYEP